MNNNGVEKILPVSTVEAILVAARGHVTEFLFPGARNGTAAAHSPDVDDMARSEKYQALLVDRMMQIARAGGDPASMTAAQILPDINPAKLELTNADYGYPDDDEEPPEAAKNALKLR